MVSCDVTVITVVSHTSSPFSPWSPFWASPYWKQRNTIEIYSAFLFITVTLKPRTLVKDQKLLFLLRNIPQSRTDSSQTLTQSTAVSRWQKSQSPKQAAPYKRFVYCQKALWILMNLQTDAEISANREILEIGSVTW